MRKLLLIVALTTVFAACGDGGEEEMNHDHSNHANNGATNEGFDTYSDGLMKMTANGHFHVMLMAAEPGPPDVGENTWTLRVMDMDDNPVTDAKVTVTPFMPAHGHGTSPAEYAGSSNEDGSYVAGPFDLFMPGVWETTVTVEGEMTDTAKFSFLLEG